jgi:hypothetical protein
MKRRFKIKPKRDPKLAGEVTFGIKELRGPADTDKAGLSNAFLEIRARARRNSSLLPSKRS